MTYNITFPVLRYHVPHNELWNSPKAHRPYTRLAIGIYVYSTISEFRWRYRINILALYFIMMRTICSPIISATGLPRDSCNQNRIHIMSTAKPPLEHVI